MSDDQITKPMEVGVYGALRPALREAVEQALPFQNANRSLRGFRGRHSGFGQLNDTEREQYAEDDVTFTVVSYDTPIAWLRADGTAYFVGQYFSPTTSRHLAAVQGLGKAVTS